MSYHKAVAHLEKYNLENKVIVLAESSATVELAAAALKVEPARITKTMAFYVNDRVILVLTAGDVKIDNTKYRSQFATKARMLAYDDCEELVGHPAGGVCPFGINVGIDVYLDISLQRFVTVFPACGSGNSAVELTIAELQQAANSKAWIDVTKPKDSQPG